jgi:hypothetical protein
MGEDIMISVCEALKEELAWWENGLQNRTKRGKGDTA